MQPIGVYYEMRIYANDLKDLDKSNKIDTVSLALRKVMYAPPKPMAVQLPSIETSKVWAKSTNKLELKLSLDKEVYYHGESLSIHVRIKNNSCYPVEMIQVSICQFVDMRLAKPTSAKFTVADMKEHLPAGPRPTFLNRTYTLKPELVERAKMKRPRFRAAVDGQVWTKTKSRAGSRREKTQDHLNLASGTVVTDEMRKENNGILVHYKVNVKLHSDHVAGDFEAELPFMLLHANPEDAIDESSQTDQGSNSGKDLENTDLIQLNTCYNDQESSADDMIFEDFARLRLNGQLCA